MRLKQSRSVMIKLADSWPLERIGAVTLCFAVALAALTLHSVLARRWGIKRDAVEALANDLIPLKGSGGRLRSIASFLNLLSGIALLSLAFGVIVMIAG